MATDEQASRHVELERKFSVTEATSSPSFEDMTGTPLPRQLLEATYFDTEGHDLAANRITLRRRTGGPDAGWHLKLPATVGTESRTEVRAPLGPQLPAELHDMVLAIVRDRPLQPVAVISTQRDVTVLHDPDGSPVAEFCDDRVTAGRVENGVGTDGHRWREWELELVDGEAEGSSELLDRLCARLLDAGATPAGHASKLAKALGTASPAPLLPPADPVHRALIEQIGLLREWDRAVRVDAEDSVHQMRVTIRQIRSLLQASEEAFGLDDDAAILAELRELAGVLGIARDAEVLADRYRDALDALPTEAVRGPVRERLVDGALGQYQSGLNRSLKAMRSPRYFRLLDALDALAVSPAPAPETGHQPETIDSMYRRIAKRARAGKAGTAHERDEALHRVRKAAKRLRYVAAATGESAVAERAKAIQSLLGDHQDSVVSRTHLLQVADSAHNAGEDTFTYGALYLQEQDLGQQCREQLRGALKALRRSVRKSG